MLLNWPTNSLLIGTQTFVTNLRKPLIGLYTQPVYSSIYSASAFNALHPSTTSLWSGLSLLYFPNTIFFKHFSLQRLCSSGILCFYITGCSLPHILTQCNSLIFKGQWSNKECWGRRTHEMYSMWPVTGWQEKYNNTHQAEEQTDCSGSTNGHS